MWDGEIVPKMQNVTKHVLSAVLPELRAVGVRAFLMTLTKIFTESYVVDHSEVLSGSGLISYSTNR